MSFYLFLDPARNPGPEHTLFEDPTSDIYRQHYAVVPVEEWTVCRSLDAAIALLMLYGKLPHGIVLTYDLGNGDTAIDFLRWAINDFWDGVSPPPKYRLIETWAARRVELNGYMRSWWNLWLKHNPARRMGNLRYK